MVAVPSRYPERLLAVALSSFPAALRPPSVTVLVEEDVWPRWLLHVASLSASSFPGMPMWERTQATAVSCSFVSLADRSCLICRSMPDLGGCPWPRLTTVWTAAWLSESRRMVPSCCMLWRESAMPARRVRSRCG